MRDGIVEINTENYVSSREKTGNYEGKRIEDTRSIQLIDEINKKKRDNGRNHFGIPKNRMS